MDRGRYLGRMMSIARAGFGMMAVARDSAAAQAARVAHLFAVIDVAYRELSSARSCRLIHCVLFANEGRPKQERACVSQAS